MAGMEPPTCHECAGRAEEEAKVAEELDINDIPSSSSEDEEESDTETYIPEGDGAVGWSSGKRRILRARRPGYSPAKTRSRSRKSGEGG